jgi:hypothetical protein
MQDPFYIFIPPHSRLARLARNQGENKWLSFWNFVGATALLIAFLNVPFLRHHDGLGVVLYLLWSAFAIELYMVEEAGNSDLDDPATSIDLSDELLDAPVKANP